MVEQIHALLVIQKFASHSSENSLLKLGEPRVSSFIGPKIPFRGV